MKILGGMKKLWIFLEGLFKTRLFLFGFGRRGSFLYILGLFLKVKVQNGNIFWGR